MISWANYLGECQPAAYRGPEPGVGRGERSGTAADLLAPNVDTPPELTRRELRKQKKADLRAKLRKMIAWQP